MMDFCPRSVSMDPSSRTHHALDLNVCRQDRRQSRYFTIDAIMAALCQFTPDHLPATWRDPVCVTD